MISTAEQYIGQSLDALEGACGSPQGSSYEDDPETGKTGFHYYSNFTVSTTVDEMVMKLLPEYGQNYELRIVTEDGIPILLLPAIKLISGDSYYETCIIKIKR